MSDNQSNWPDPYQITVIHDSPTDSARLQPPIGKPAPIPDAVFDAVCEALAYTDLTMLKRLFGNLKMALIDRDDYVMVQEANWDDSHYEALQADVDEILGALRELVEQENAWPVMPA